LSDEPDDYIIISSHRTGRKTLVLEKKPKNPSLSCD